MQGDTNQTKEDWAACVQAYEEQLSAAVLRPKEQFDMFLVMVMRNALLSTLQATDGFHIVI